MKNIAIIPARSGSKGLKDKNIKELNGNPLIYYSINAAKESGLFDIIYVSTDSAIYRSIALELGADVPFLRNSLTSADDSSTWDAVREALLKYKEAGLTFDNCFILQPTSPLRDSKDIIEAYKIFTNNGAKSVVSVCEVNHPIQWCFELDKDLNMKNFSKNPFRNYRRQDLTINYRENGAIYICKCIDVLNNKFDLYEKDCFAYIMDKDRSIDIDSILDFNIASLLMKESGINDKK